ncbi:uncharacterized protein K444DRAFT_604118 [Hyaloscypha bicolor E]|uniref:EthD domain-containing protein n=1 Tax=Hyaloscypha bicolor E TaxID=1095630 RepID=A0A2J6SIU7_9HELO|nr:uncharacterized protein K444DRAFT_604118 [Hyaloscypha bicolor E]PMD50689.1 hypothetical protein K444DRAFT_604118 [Hyaloscypha bicolor E]
MQGSNHPHSASMSEVTGEIKQIACGRRKPNMTRKEYNDHRFRVHGALSDAEEASPHKYIQTPIFDAAFGARPGGLNLNHAWVGRDDVTELTFRGWDHLKQVFSSNWVKTKVGPDGPLFADFETTMALLATEEPVPLPYEMKPTADDGFATVATYFLATPDNERHGGAVQDKVQTLLVRALSENTRQEVYKVEVNVGITSMYKLFMKSAASVPYVRKAQARFESLARDALDFSTSFIVFGKEALVLDHGRGIGFDPKRQPMFDDTEYFNAVSHLDMK